MVKQWSLLVAVVALGLAFLAAPASAAPAPQVTPTGCTTSVQWIQQGSNYFDGLGNVQCTSGRYRAKAACINNQTGAGYVNYGTQVVAAPATATVLCNTGNSAEAVYAVTDPLDDGLTGCISWTEWVNQGSNLFYGRGQAQCDTGQYRVKELCENLQTGDYYVVYGTQVVSAPDAVSVTCNTGNPAQIVQAVADPAGTDLAGCMTWSAWVVQGSTLYYGRGSAQCDTGGLYEAQLACHNTQTGQDYVAYGTVVTAPDTSTGMCQSGNTATAVTAVAI